MNMHVGFYLLDNSRKEVSGELHGIIMESNIQ